MDENQRLHLQKMIAANNVEDQTGLIRELKHSHILDSIRTEQKVSEKIEADLKQAILDFLAVFK